MAKSGYKHHKEADKCKNACLKSKLDKEVGGIRIPVDAEMGHLDNKTFSTNTDTHKNVVKKHLKAVTPEREELLSRADRGAVGEQHIKSVVRQKKNCKRKQEHQGE